jgi:phage FluMu protein gp41
LRPLAAEEAARDLFRVASIDRGPGRTGSPESQAAKLQARRSLLGAFLDEIEGKAAHFRVILLVKDLKPIDDRANWADHIMANPGAKQRGKVERVEGKHRHLSSIRKAKLG